MPFIHILGNCFFPVLDSDVGTCIFFFSHGLFSTTPQHCSPVLTSVRASPLSAARGGRGCALQTARGPSRKPQEPSHGGAWHCASLRIFKASLLPTSVKAVGTWHFCKSDFQVFSRHSEEKKTHLWATCSQTSWRSRHRFAQTSSS